MNESNDNSNNQKLIVVEQSGAVLTRNIGDFVNYQKIGEVVNTQLKAQLKDNLKEQIREIICEEKIPIEKLPNAPLVFYKQNAQQQPQWGELTQGMINFGQNFKDGDFLVWSADRNAFIPAQHQCNITNSIGLLQPQQIQSTNEPTKFLCDTTPPSWQQPPSLPQYEQRMLLLEKKIKELQQQHAEVIKVLGQLTENN